MAYPIPPWIAQPADPAAQYATGLGIGVRIGAEQAAQQYQQQQMLRAQAQDEFERQYKTQVLNIEVDKAMRKQRAGQAFQSLVQQGVAPEVALMQVGADLGESMADILRVQGITEQRQAANELAKARIAENARSSDIRERELGARISDIERKRQRYSMTEPEKAKLNSLYAEMRGVNSELTKIPPPTENDDEETLNKRTALVNRKSSLQKQIDKAAAATEPPPVEQRAQPASPGAPNVELKAGEVVKQNGKRYRFKGGDVRDPANYEEL